MQKSELFAVAQDTKCGVSFVLEKGTQARIPPVITEKCDHVRAPSQNSDALRRAWKPNKQPSHVQPEHGVSSVVKV